jgi:parvulin-like peptidyl-prolyl cis-trans isomerase-like protein
MIRSRPLGLALTAGLVLAVAACDGFKEAMTAHVDVAARAGSQELSVTRLADLLGKSQVPLRPDVAETVANLWVDYQLLGRAAAHNDSLNDPKLIDNAMWGAYANGRITKWMQTVSQRWTAVDSATFPARYEQGELLAARHILVNSAEPNDSARRKAEQIRAEAAANPSADAFAKLADKYNQQGAAGPGGDLGVFPRQQMVKEFGDAVVELKPGAVSAVVKSQFGYHIIRRSTYAEVKQNFDQLVPRRAAQVGESTYVASLDAASNVQVKPNAPAVMKAIAAQPAEHEKDNTVIATAKGTELTAAGATKWIGALPNAEQVRQQLRQVPDSVIPYFVRALIRQDLLLKQADSAKVQLDTTEVSEMRHGFVSMVANTWAGLGVMPKLLADSGKTEADRERVAASRVDNYVDRLLTQNEQFVQVPPILSTALREKYDAKVNKTGIERAIERATKIRVSADSARAAQTPASAVPMGGQPGQAPQGQPQAQPPATKKP